MLAEQNSANKLRARIFNALSDPARLDIIEFLRGGEKCVCEIIPHVGLVQPLVSRHLKILKECGIVKVRKLRNRRLYSITEPAVFELIDAITPKLIDSLSKRMIEQVS